MSVRTKNQQLAIDTAMAIFNHGRFTRLDIQWMHAPTRAAIASSVAERNETVLARIAVAYPDLPIELGGGRRHGGTWAQLLATEVVIQIIRDVIGVNPVYGDRDESWIFHGRMLRVPAERWPVELLPGLIVDDVTRPDGLGSQNSYLRQAAKRHRVLTARMPG